MDFLDVDMPMSVSIVSVYILPYLFNRLTYLLLGE
jgi:hypothetical protein